jgi:hypothetical protein
VSKGHLHGSVVDGRKIEVRAHVAGILCLSVWFFGALVALN